MRKLFLVFALLCTQAFFGVGTANATATLHFGYLDDGVFVPGSHLWNGELRPITPDSAAFQIQGTAQGTVAGPVKLFLGIALADSGFNVPDITGLMISNAAVNIPDVQGVFKASMTNGSGDAYSLLGLDGSGNNSQNWSNWSSAYQGLIDRTFTNGSFGIFEYDLLNTGLVGNKNPVGVAFSDGLPAGTFVFGWAQFDETTIKGRRTSTGSSYFSTPFTETGMTTSVPEPTTILLLGLGLVGAAGMRRRLKRNKHC